MSYSADKKIPDFFLKIVEGHAVHHKVYIKFWITLATFSLIILMPTQTSDGKMKLPFDIGIFNKEDFYPLGFAIVSLLLLCFGSAVGQCFRISQLLHRSIDKLK